MLVHGSVIERRSPGLIEPQQVFVSAKGALAATVQQSSESTHFAFERGCRLRVQISEPTTPGAGHAGHKEKP